MQYHDITKDDMKNGDGLRVVLWLAGCDHACPGCQNPVTWDPDGGLPFDDAAYDELMELLARPYISGLTLSGGDPLYVRDRKAGEGGNREEVTMLCREVKERFPQKTIWLYTGEVWEEIYGLPVMRDVDVLVDGPYLEAQRDAALCWKGSRNQRVIDVRATLASKSPQIPILHCADYYEGGGRDAAQNVSRLGMTGKYGDDEEIEGRKFCTPI